MTEEKFTTQNNKKRNKIHTISAWISEALDIAVKVMLVASSALWTAKQ